MIRLIQKGKTIVFKGKEMRFVKGLYEKELRNHENIKNLLKEGDNEICYLQKNKDFTIDLRIYIEDEDLFENNYTVKTLGQNHNFSDKELKDFCIEYLKNLKANEK